MLKLSKLVLTVWHSSDHKYEKNIYNNMKALKVLRIFKIKKVSIDVMNFEIKIDDMFFTKLFET